MEIFINTGYNSDYIFKRSSLKVVYVHLFALIPLLVENNIG